MSASDQPPAVARQIHAASRGFVALTLALTGLAVAASFTLSFHAQASIGVLIGLNGGLQFALPAATDLWIVCALLSLAVLKARGQGTSTGRTGWLRIRPSGQQVQYASLLGWTVASIGLNVGHALTVYKGDSVVVALGLSAVATLFPLGVMVGSEGVLALVVAPSEVPAVALAKTALVNAGVPVAATSARRSLQEQDVDAMIAAALTVEPTASLRGVSAKLGVSVHRVRTVKARLSAAIA